MNTQTIKIVFCANSSWYLYNFRRNTIKSLVSHGYNVVAIAPYDDYSCRLEKMGVTFFDIDIIGDSLNPILELRTLLQFNSIFKRCKVHVVLNFTPKCNIYSTLAAKYNGIKVINNIAGLGIVFTGESFISKILNQLLYFFVINRFAGIFLKSSSSGSLAVSSRKEFFVY